VPLSGSFAENFLIHGIILPQKQGFGKRKKVWTVGIPSDIIVE
jgi:hypothetical protein